MQKSNECKCVEFEDIIMSNENYKVCIDCGCLIENFKNVISFEMQQNKFIDFPFRIRRYVNNFNISIDSDEMLNNEDINFICYIIVNTRMHLNKMHRVKMFHFKYLMYIILQNMGYVNLLKYCNKINKKTIATYMNNFNETYNKLSYEYRNNLMKVDYIYD